MPRAEERLDMFLGEVNVVSGHFNQKSLLLLCFQHLREVGTAQSAERFAAHHPLFIGGHDKNSDPGIIRGDPANLVEASRIAVLLLIERNTHAAESLQSEGSNNGASLADTSGEYHRIQAAHRRDVGANIFPDSITKRLERE